MEVFQGPFYVETYARHKSLVSLRGNSRLFPRNETIKANVLDIC